MPSRGSPNGALHTPPQPDRLVAIARNGWSSSIGTAGRHQSEQVVAITRCAQTAWELASRVFTEFWQQGGPLLDIMRQRNVMRRTNSLRARELLQQGCMVRELVHCSAA